MKVELEHTLAECRDAYPVPEVGSELEGLWGQAMCNPASVGAYVKACANSQKKEIDALKGENERLLAANLDCIAHYEDARAELERIKALPPAAWRSSMGHGVTLKETITDEQKALAWDGKPMWQPLIALGRKT